MREVNPQLPAELERIIAKALEKDCQARYQSAAEMRTDLVRLKQGAVATVSDRRAAIGTSPLQRARRRLWMAGVTACLIPAGVAAFLQRPALPPPRITGYKQLTHDGRNKMPVLATDGPRIYFSEDLPPTSSHPPRFALVSVSTLGGETVPLPTPLQVPFLEDISPDGTELLVTDRSTGAMENAYYVVRTADGSTRRLGNLMGHCGGWLADGRIIYLNGKDIGMVNRDGSGAHRIAAAPERPTFTSASLQLTWYPRSSPDGRLISFERGGGIWRVDADGSNLYPLLPGWKLPATGGAWTPDGKYFVFMAGVNGNEIWAIREHADLFHKANHEPVQLSSGSVEVGRLVPSRDGKKLLVLEGLGQSGKVWRYDATTRKLLLLPDRIGTMHFDLSRDGRHLVYASGGALWTSKPDGSEQLQLTFPPLNAWGPRWSPDGKQIAFVGTAPDDPHADIYFVPAEGGNPTPLLFPYRTLSFPDWSPDGKRLVFSQITPEGVGIREVELATRQVSVVPGSQGLSDLSWSPDGRYLAATGPRIPLLKLFDFTTRRWQELAIPDGGGTPRWSSDSKYVYYAHSKIDTTIIYRVRLSDLKVEPVLSSGELKLAPSDEWGFTLWPDNSLLVTATRRHAPEILALDWEAP